eukprot:scaffold1671_cov344-Pavlova_lutheri.AAC.16
MEERWIWDHPTQPKSKCKCRCKEDASIPKPPVYVRVAGKGRGGPTRRGIPEEEGRDERPSRPG